MFENVKGVVRNHMDTAKGRAGEYGNQATTAAVSAFLGDETVVGGVTEQFGVKVGGQMREVTNNLIHETSNEVRGVSDSEIIAKIESKLITPEDGPFRTFFKRVFARILFGGMRIGSYVALRSFWYKKPEEEEDAAYVSRGLVNLFGQA